MVNETTMAATQNVYHCTLRLLSHHHCAIVLGSASSNTCLSIPNRSCQNTKFSTWRSSVVRCPDLQAATSIADLFSRFLNHLQDFWSYWGNSKDSVCSVSFTKPLGNRLSSWCCCRNEAWWKMAILVSSTVRWRWSERLSVHIICSPAMRSRLCAVNSLSSLTVW